MNLIRSKPISRRTLLRGAGAAVGLPWLEAMTPAVGRAAPPKNPVRMAALYMPNGAFPLTWTPECPGQSVGLVAIRIIWGGRAPAAPATTQNDDKYTRRGCGYHDSARSDRCLGSRIVTCKSCPRLAWADRRLLQRDPTWRNATAPGCPYPEGSGCRCQSHQWHSDRSVRLRGFMWMVRSELP